MQPSSRRLGDQCGRSVHLEAEKPIYHHAFDIPCALGAVAAKKPGQNLASNAKNITAKTRMASAVL